MKILSRFCKPRLSDSVPTSDALSLPTLNIARLDDELVLKVGTPAQALKIKEEQQLKVGDIIADRERERSRLTFQKQQLQISLSRLETATITPPTPPASVPTVTTLPPISYLEHEAAIEKAKTTITSVESQIELKNQEINYLSQVPNLDP